MVEARGAGRVGAITGARIVLLTPPGIIEERVDGEACQHYFDALLLAVFEAMRTRAASPGDVQIGGALLPAGLRLVEVRVRPTSLDTSLCRGLMDTVRELEIPDVRNGAVVFALLLRLEGGAVGPPTSFPLPFSEALSRGANDYDEVLLRLAGLDPPAGPRSPAPPRWWRLLSWLFGLRQVFVRGRAEPPPPEPEEDPSDLKVPRQFLHGVSEESTIEELTDRIQRFPRCARFWWFRASAHTKKEEHDLAIEDCSRYISLRPEVAWGYAQRGASQLRAGRMGPALTDFDAALRLDPDYIWALQGRANVYSEIEAWDQAEADFSRAIELEPFRPRNRMYRARLRLARNQWDRAREDLDEILRLDPHDGEAYKLRAESRMAPRGARREETYAAIVADLGNAIRLRPREPELHVRRAEVVLHGDPSAAERDCGRALEIEPECTSALGVRGIARLHMGDPDGALRDCTAAIERGTDRPEVFLCRGRILFGRNETEPASGDIERALELSPQHPGALCTRGNIHLHRDEFEAAIDDYTEALRLEPSLSEAYVGRGLARRAVTDVAGAIEDLEEALRREPDLAAAHYYLGETLAAQGKEDEALRSLCECIRVEEGLSLPYFLRARIRLRRDDAGGALDDLNAAIRLDPGLAEAYLARGHLLLGRGERDAAIEDFERLIDLCPTLGLAYGSRGRAWILKGDLHRGAEDYEEAIRVNPESAEAFILDRLLVEATHDHERERYAEAIESATEAIHRCSDFVPAYYQRACSSWYSGRLADAVEDFTRVLEIVGELPHALSCRGQVYAEMGEFRLALADIDRYLDLVKAKGDTSTMAYALSGRGLARAGLGLHEEASRDIEESLRLRPENAWAHLNLGLLREKEGRLPEAVGALHRALQAKEPALPPRKRRQAEEMLARLDPPSRG